MTTQTNARLMPVIESCAPRSAAGESLSLRYYPFLLSLESSEVTDKETVVISLDERLACYIEC